MNTSEEDASDWLRVELVVVATDGGRVAGPVGRVFIGIRTLLSPVRIRVPQERSPVRVPIWKSWKQFI